MNSNTQTKEKGLAVAAANPSESKHSARKFSATSTATEAQYERMLAALIVRDCTTDDFRGMGIYQVSARIFGLRKRGYNIVTTLFDGWSTDGFPHARMARYHLIPDEVQA